MTSKILGATADNPLEFLNDYLYAEPGMPKGCIMQLLACDEQYRGELKALLKKYREMLPTKLPKRVLPSCGLEDKMEIKLVPEQSPSNRRCIGNLQQNNWQ